MPDGPAITRRGLIQAGASAAAATAVGCAGAAKGTDRPNVLLIVVDTLRTDHAYGDRARTPAIDALAREGLSFTRAYPEAMPTVPARNSILSGRREFPFRRWHDHPGLLDLPGWEPIDDVRTAFTTVLRRAGYWTAYATDNPFLGFASPYAPLRRSFHRFERTGGQLGVARPPSSVSERELRHWVHPAVDNHKTRRRVRRYLANGRYSDDESRSFGARVLRDGARLLELGARRRPFALVVDTYQPHEPWTPPRRYLDMYGDPDYRGREPAMPAYSRVSSYLDEDEREPFLRRLRALHAAEVTMTDRWIGFLVERLHDLGLERETAIVLVSDHGFYLGERGWTGKISIALHPELIHVPLIVIDPERRMAGERSAHFASTHDIGPTLLSMTGVGAPRAMEGIDLSRPFEGRRPADRPHAYGGYRDSFYIRTDRWALISENRPGSLRLFDLERDPGEETNVASRHPEVARGLYDVVRREAGGPLPYYGD